MFDFSVTFGITFINIFILFLILRAVLFKPVTKFMAERAKKVQDSIDHAMQDKKEARELLEQYEAKLKDVKVIADEIHREAREIAEKEAARIVAEGRVQAGELVAQTQKQLEAERRAALSRFNAEAAIIVMAAASKLAAREISGDDNKRYVNMLLEELAARKG
jgi:F-type H+-transporting ATPase subunit b